MTNDPIVNITPKKPPIPFGPRAPIRPAPASAAREQQGPLMLQGDHGPVAYRKVWMAELT